MVSIRVSIQSSELGPRIPYPASVCVSPLDPKGRGATLQGVRGWGGPFLDVWKECLALCICTLWEIETDAKIYPEIRE